MSVQASLSAKGQIVIPKALRDRLRWAPGLRFDLIERGGVVTLQPRPDTPAFAPTTIDDLRALPAAGPAQPVEVISGLDDAALARLLADD